MAGRLRNLRITKVDVVDEGANQGAFMRLFKRSGGNVVEKALARDRVDAFVSLAKRYQLIAPESEPLANALRAANSAGEEAMESLIHALDEGMRLAEQGAFYEIGKRGHVHEEDAWARIEQAARDIRQQRPELSRANAIDEACKRHPDWVAEYEKGRV